MKIDLSCPVELRAYRIFSCSDGSTQAVLKLYNLTDYAIESIDAVLLFRDALNEKSAAEPRLYRNLTLKPRSFFELPVSLSALEDAARIEFHAKEICFTDHEKIWRCANGPFCEWEPLPPLGAAQRQALIDRYGADAVCQPTEGRTGWRCVCGRVNLASSAECIRCRRNRASLFLPLEAEKPSEAKAVFEAYDRHRSRQRARMLILSGFAFAAAAIFLFYRG